MILLIDNYDSFTHNLARYIRRLGADVRILRNDAVELDLAASEAQAIVISPGPCGPLQAGRCIAMVQAWSGRIPILGICLGHQVICHAWGGRIVRASRPIHGQAFPMDFQPSDLFSGICSGTRFARYHSLVAEIQSMPECLEIIATCQTPLKNSGAEANINAKSSSAAAKEVLAAVEVMAVQHREHPTYGVQFHPESILSEAGYQLLANFLRQSSGQNDHQMVQTLPRLDLTDSRAENWQCESSAAAAVEHTAVLPQY